jgi:hypothetical protein
MHPPYKFSFGAYTDNPYLAWSDSKILKDTLRLNLLSSTNPERKGWLSATPIVVKLLVLIPWEDK